MPTDLFTQAAAARYVGVSRKSVKDRADADKLETEDAHGVVLYTRRSLDEWKAERAARGTALVKASR